MVIFYDKDTRECIYTEWDSLVPTCPVVESAMTEEEKIQKQRELLSENNMDFVSVPQNCSIADMKICFNTLGNFIGLQPK